MDYKHYYHQTNNGLPSCPVCFKQGKTVEISENEKIEALAMWDLFDFIGRIEVMSQKYRCTSCGYCW